MRRKVFVLLTLLLFVSISAVQAVQDYSDVRIKKIPVAMQCWTFRKFTFFETLDKVNDLGIEYLEAYPGQALGGKMGDAKFDHNLADDQIKVIKRALMDKGITLVSYGVVLFENNEASMRKVFDFARKMGIRTINTEPAYDDFSLIEKMVREYNIKIAIHNHPEPSKYARPETVYSHVGGLDERIGSCGDTGHWMRTSINPVEALQVLSGRITNMHLKDLDEFGKSDALDVPFGQGKANIHDILAELTLQNYQGYISIEHENPDDVDNPSPPIRKGLEYIKSITYYEGYTEILPSNNGRYSKHGWNHYGPGYLELDEKTGILTSQGGMGLFWYSVKKYKDFILDIDFKCAKEETNSGIFLRVPEMLTSNSYIYHSFEIQIGDDGEGIHGTGAVYDAEPPRRQAFKPTGEWNHFSITFIGDKITVELNGEPVVDWKAEPRGKIRDFADEGYIGLQNHDSRAVVYFRNIFVKELD
ncbi:family 16 glycoside hydrolase [Candidatus Latescibacterota bacterium]